MPAVLGAVLGLVGLFALDWGRSVTFLDIRRVYLEATAAGYTGVEKWTGFYLEYGAFVAVVLTVVSPVLWTLGVVRNQAGAKRFGGITKKSLAEGRTGPTRVAVTVIAGICFAYHLGTMFALTDNNLGELGPGGWLVVAGAALSVLGAAIGPRLR